MFFPLTQRFTSAVVLYVRSEAPPSTVLASIRSVVRDLDANLPIFDARTLDEHMQTAVFAQKMGANMLGAMGLLALVLAAVGLYGVMAYAVSQRTQEMGIRLALGASPGDLLRMVLRHGLLLTTIGLAIGLALSFGVVGPDALAAARHRAARSADLRGRPAGVAGHRGRRGAHPGQKGRRCGSRGGTAEPVVGAGSHVRRFAAPRLQVRKCSKPAREPAGAKAPNLRTCEPMASPGARASSTIVSGDEPSALLFTRK